MKNEKEKKRKKEKRGRKLRSPLLVGRTKPRVDGEPGRTEGRTLSLSRSVLRNARKAKNERSKQTRREKNKKTKRKRKKQACDTYLHPFSRIHGCSTLEARMDGTDWVPIWASGDIISIIIIIIIIIIIVHCYYYN
jgi:hypothetical protein